MSNWIPNVEFFTGPFLTTQLFGNEKSPEVTLFDSNPPSTVST